MARKTTSQKYAGKKAAAKKSAAKPLGVRLQGPSPRPIEVKLLAKPPKFIKPKRIHPRHLLPLVKEGMEREFHSQTSETILRPLGMAAPLVAADELAIVTNTELTEPTQQQTASNVGEPSVAVNGNIVFFTGNWYASVSSDGGRTFRFIDPGSDFPDPAPNAHFCCDQVVHYIEQIDTFVWLLQYGPDSGDNVQRLAFAKTADVVNGRWRLFDITTRSLNVAGAFLDFPDIAVGANNLYVTTNIFGPGDKFGTAVVRIPFSGIQSGRVTIQPFVSLELQSFRVAQNCGTTAYFAAHQDTSTLTVFSWNESQAIPVPHSIGVARWIGGNGYMSRTPDGNRWLDRADPRITGATMAGNELWFAWSVDRRSNHRPNPFVQIARIDASTLTLLENFNLFDQNSATCYAALNTNSDNEVGVSYIIGGGPINPSHAVGILTRTRKDVVVAKGDRGPRDPDTGTGEWGDYLTVRRLYPNQKLYAAAGFTMKGTGDGSNRDVTPRFVVFGRAGAAGISGGTGVVFDSVGTGTGTGLIVDLGVNVGPPFTDVNSLPTVTAVVAEKIKAAAMAMGQRELPAEAALLPLKIVKPGVERWPVKTGIDHDVALVGKNIINGQDLGVGIVETTVEELIRMPRPFDMTPPTRLFPAYQNRRRGPVEVVVWRLEADIIALKLEGDGDYHLVLQGASGQTMIAEIPTPTPPFVDPSSPWTANLRAARQAADNKLIRQLSPADFVQMDDALVPREAISPSSPVLPLAMPFAYDSFLTPEDGAEVLLPTFRTKTTPTPARITGVGFFDRVHDQTGVSLLNGVELHPVLKIEWL